MMFPERSMVLPDECNRIVFQILSLEFYFCAACKWNDRGNRLVHFEQEGFGTNFGRSGGGSLRDRDLENSPQFITNKKYAPFHLQADFAIVRQAL